MVEREHMTELGYEQYRYMYYMTRTVQLVYQKIMCITKGTKSIDARFAYIPDMTDVGATNV